MRKDFADSFAAEGEEARDALAGLATRAVDALDLVLSKAPEESARKRFAFAKEYVLPLLTRIEDSGDREAALEDAAEALKLKATQMKHLRKVLAAMEEPEDKGQGDCTLERRSSRYPLTRPRGTGHRESRGLGGTRRGCA